MAFRCRMHGSAVDRAEYAPHGVVDVARLHARALRVGHCRKIAVVRRADPAHARGVGAELTWAAAAHEWRRRAFHRARSKTVAAGRETILVEIGIARRARTQAVPDKGVLMRIDKAHGFAGIAD